MTKISELTSIVTAAATDIIAVVQGGVTKKATVQDYRDAGIIPTADQATALAAYQAALAAAEADQVLTAAGPGEASFAAPAGGGGLPGNPTRVILQLSQEGVPTNAPTITEIFNETGLTVSSSYVDVGLYFITFSGNFFPVDLGRVFTQASTGPNSLSFPGQVIDSAAYDQATLAIVTQSTPGTPANGILYKSIIVIDVYP